MEKTYHRPTVPSVILVLFIQFVVEIWCAHLNFSKLNCVNDYITTMDCDFTSDRFMNCSGYSLDFESPIREHYTCPLINSEENANYYRSKCGCTVELPEFVNGEEYIVQLTEGGKVLNSTIITVDNIKPKAPDVLPVIRMENGNYKVTWNKNYPENNFLYEHLEIQLSYKKKGEADKDAKIISASQLFHEILGSDLEPSTEYVVKARSYSTYYSTQFSDWSREVAWTSAAVVGSTLKAVIPIVCVLLVFIICSFYYCGTRVKAECWDKIPAPKNDIKNMLPGHPKVFIPKHYDPASDHADLMIVGKTQEKPRPTSWNSECEQEDPYKNVSSRVSVKDSGVFSCDGSQDRSSGSVGSCSSSDSGYKHILYSQLLAPSSQNGSSEELPAIKTSSFPAQPMLSCDVCPIYRAVEVLDSPSSDPKKNQQTLVLSRKAPVSTTGEEADLKCPFSVDILKTVVQLKTCGVDDGYESFGEAISRAALRQANFPACTLEPCGDGYQDLQTIVENRADWHSEADKAYREASSVEGPEKSTGQVWEPSKFPKWDILDSITCASPFAQKSNLESSSHSALTTSPIIQIHTDSSYHRV